jgi:hypothetical protein
VEDCGAAILASHPSQRTRRMGHPSSWGTHPVASADFFRSL